jgi:hypothetical protein
LELSRSFVTSLVWEKSGIRDPGKAGIRNLEFVFINVIPLNAEIAASQIAD